MQAEILTGSEQRLCPRGGHLGQGARLLPFRSRCDFLVVLTLQVQVRSVQWQVRFVQWRRRRRHISSRVFWKLWEPFLIASYQMHLTRVMGLECARSVTQLGLTLGPHGL